MKRKKRKNILWIYIRLFLRDVFLYYKAKEFFFKNYIEKIISYLIPICLGRQKSREKLRWSKER